MKQLIAYFSRAGENYFGGTLRVVPVGNTELAAKLLEQLTGADLFRIEPAQPYAEGYRECVAQASAQFRQDARPELKAWPESLEGYDTIYLGYPNYCGTMPMPVFTFLEHFDFTGKTILPFCTNEGSGMGRSGEDIRRLCPGAAVGTGLSILGSRAGESEDKLRQWLAQNRP